MTYGVRELGQETGAPIELYEFQAGSQYWRFTSGFSPITYLGNVFSPYPLKRGNIVQSPDAGKLRLSIECARDLPVVTRYLQYSLDGILAIRIFRYHNLDTEFITYWQGRVIQVMMTDSSNSRIDCELAFSQLQFPGARRRYQPGCPHVLYKVGCNASEPAFQLAGVLLSASGTLLTSATFGSKPDNFNGTGVGWWVGGKFITQIGGQSAYRVVLGHLGSTIVIESAIQGLAQNAAFTISPGCDRTMSACNTKFGNIDNYGGFPYKPTQNPFTSSPY
jgi:hypothetical protein